MPTYSTEAQVSNLATRVATEVKSLRTLINNNAADLSALTTSAKGDLVAAINELDAAIDGLSGGGSASNLDDLTDVAVTSPATGHVLRHNGTTWVNVLGTTHFDAAGAASTVNSALTAHTGASAGAHAATAISYTAGGGIVATTVQAAIQEVHAAIGTAITNLIDGAPGALDTLNEIAAALGDDPDVITDLLAAVGNRVRYDAAQALSEPQQTQARSNIGVITSTANFVTVFETGLN